MRKPRLLDLFCGAGGTSVGYAQVGFEVVGVDIAPQPRYPYEFIQADALTFDLDGFDVIHASPPCQAYTRARHMQGRMHPALLEAIRQRLMQTSLPWVIENVSDAPMPHFLMLCGTQFGLKVYRHRQFESSHLLMSPGHCQHPYALLPGYVSIFGHRIGGHQTGNKGNQYQRYPLSVGQAAMGIDWMNRDELSQAIPPAYTHYIGSQLLDAIGAECEVPA